MVLCKSTLTTNQPATDLKVPFTPSGFKNSLKWLLELRKVPNFHYSFIVTDTKIWEGPKCKASLVISVEWARMCYPSGTGMWLNTTVWGSSPKLQFLVVFHDISMIDWIIVPPIEFSLSPPLSLPRGHADIALAQSPNFIILLIIQVWPVHILSHLLHISSVGPPP